MNTWTLHEKTDHFPKELPALYKQLTLCLTAMTMVILYQILDPVAFRRCKSGVGSSKISKSLPGRLWFYVLRPWIHFCVEEVRAGGMAMLIFNLHLPANTLSTGLSNGSAAIACPCSEEEEFYSIFCQVYLQMVLTAYYSCGKHLELTEQIQQAVLAVKFVYFQCTCSILQVLHEELSSSLCKHIGPGL